MSDCKKWRRTYRDVFKYRNLYSSPLILSLSNIRYSDLLDEFGNEVSDEKKNMIDTTVDWKPELIDQFHGTTCFRLKTIVEKADIKFFIPIVDEFDNLNVTGHLVEIQVV